MLRGGPASRADLLIHGQMIQLEFSDPSDWGHDGAMGRSNSTMGRIMVNREMPTDIQASTLLHEVIHQCLSMNGFVETEEGLVSVLANSLFGFFRDNAGAANWICGRIDRLPEAPVLRGVGNIADCNQVHPAANDGAAERRI